MPEILFDAAALKNARKAAGFSQQKLATLLDVSQPLVSQWELDKSKPSDSQLEMIVEYLPQFAKIAPKSLASWLKDEREKRGLSRAKLAKRAGVSDITIFNIEHGKVANPSRVTINKLKNALGVSLPPETAEKTSKDANIEGLGELHDFDPHDRNEWPQEPGLYVFYDISERPIYVGQARQIKSRIRDHYEKFWFKRPIVERALFVRIDDEDLRRKIEMLLIKFLKSNAVINQQGVDR